MDYISIDVPCDKSKEKIVRINLQNEKDALQWLKQYEESTNSKFIVVDGMSSRPKRYIFHKKWACQFSPYNKRKNSNRNFSCPASIDILIKKVTFATKRKDYFLMRDPPLQGLLKIIEHNHPVESCESLSLLRISPETRELFHGYFNNGHRPSEAMRLHESKLKLTDSDFEFDNASINPKPRTVYYLYDIWRTSESGKTWLESSSIEMLKTKTASYKSEGTDVIINETSKGTRWHVTVVSCLMKRAHTLEESKEIIFIDSNVFGDEEQNMITIVLTATKGGAVPLAVLLHNKKDEQGYEEAFRQLKTNYPLCFGGKEAPQVFVTDDCSSQKAAIYKLWPTTPQYLYHFKMGLQEWQWLFNSKNNIPNFERISLINKFLSLMYAVNAEEFESALAVLKCCGNEKYIARVEKLLEHKVEWATLFRVDTLLRGHETNNFAEASIRILKDIVLGSSKAYNVCSLVHSITHIWDEYFCQSLLYYAYYRESTSKLIYNKLCKKLSPDVSDKIQRDDEWCFIIPCSKVGKASYEVNVLIGWCSCFSGCRGAFCKHQTLIYEVFGIGFPNCPTINSLDKPQLGVLALGDLCPAFEFFVGSEEVVVQETIENIEQMNEVKSLTVNEEEQCFPHSPQSSMESQKEDVNKLFEEAVRELLRLHVLAQENDGHSYPEALKGLITKLKLNSTPKQALQTFQDFSTSSLIDTNVSDITLNNLVDIQPTVISQIGEEKPSAAQRI